jgi:hypothetical protein
MRKRGGGDNNENFGITVSVIISFLSLIIVALLLYLFMTFFGFSVGGGGSGGRNSAPIQQNISISQQPLDDFYNIYSPPLRNNPYINTPFSGGFTQVGLLKYDDSQFLPLFGRPLSTRRDLWQYYTISNTGAGIKLPIHNEKGRDLMDDTGSPELYSEDTIITEGYEKPMKVSIYKQKQLQYV